MENQNKFELLLTEDRKPTRQLDAWIAEFISEDWYILKDCYNKRKERKYHWCVYSPKTETEHFTDKNINKFLNELGLPRYTTGKKILPIWELSKDYLDFISLNYEDYGDYEEVYALYKSGEERYNQSETSFYKIDQLAIAEALYSTLRIRKG